MPTGMRIYTMKDFLRKNESGKLNQDRLKEILEELYAAAVVHPDHNILLDFRETTVPDISMVDILKTTLEIEEMRHVLKNKIANVIPNDQDRIAIAKKAEAALRYKGLIEYRFFTEFEAAIEWLSDISE